MTRCSSRPPARPLACRVRAGIVLALLALAVPERAAGSEARAPGAPDRPHVILLTADTLRKDRLGAYGARGAATPVLDALARRSHVFGRFVSASNNTSVAFSSLHTGTHLKTHGVAYLAHFGFRLREGLPTLAESLRDAGYLTIAAVSVFHLNDRVSGLGRGFDRYLRCPPERIKQPADVTNDGLIAALDRDRAARPGAPLFLWAHYFDPHFPYAPPEPYAALFEGIRIGRATPAPRRILHDRKARDVLRKPLFDARYAGEVRFLDRQIGRLLDALDERGILERAIVVFLADHGENLGEHDLFANHVRVYGPVIDGPLFVHLPGQERMVALDARAHTVDVFPTILDLAGIDAPDGSIEGESLAPWLRGEAPAERPLFVEGRSHLEKAVVSRGSKLAYRLAPHVPAGAAFELYDLVADPGETTDLARERPADRARLERLLGDFLERQPVRVEIASEDGARHRVRAALVPFRGTAVRLRGAELETGVDHALRAPDGTVRFECEVAGGDSDRIDLDVDWSGSLACHVEVDGERSLYPGELGFSGIPEGRISLRQILLFDDSPDARAKPGGAAMPAGGGSPGPGRGFLVRREPRPDGGSRVHVSFGGLDGLEDEPAGAPPTGGGKDGGREDGGVVERREDPRFRVTLYSPFWLGDVRVEPEGAAVVSRAHERLEFGIHAAPVTVSFDAPPPVDLLLAQFRAGRRLVRLEDVRLGEGLVRPGGFEHAPFVFSPWHVMTRGENRVDEGSRPAVSVRFLREAAAASGDVLLSERERERLRILGYLK